MVKKVNDEIEDSTSNGNLNYKLKNNSKEYPISQFDGKMECPFCKIWIKNANLHFQKKPECGKRIDMIHFKNHFEEYRKKADGIRKRKHALNQRLADP